MNALNQSRVLILCALIVYLITSLGLLLYGYWPSDFLFEIIDFAIFPEVAGVHYSVYVHALIVIVGIATLFLNFTTQNKALAFALIPILAFVFVEQSSIIFYSTRMEVGIYAFAELFWLIILSYGTISLVISTVSTNTPENSELLSDKEFVKTENSDQLSDKEFVPTLLLCLFTGSIGIHRFFVGRKGSGLAMLFTLGGLGIWTLIDFISICIGSFRDADGRLIKYQSAMALEKNSGRSLEEGMAHRGPSTESAITKRSAITKLKEAKELLDLEVITQDEYDEMKESLAPIIRSN